MEKSADAFRTIREAAAELDVPQHVLRFWESKFPQIKPLKRGGGRRYYRPQDIDLLRAIKRLLYEDGFTIKGVQRILKERGVRAICAGSCEALAAPSESPETADPEDLDAPDHADEAENENETAVGAAAPGAGLVEAGLVTAPRPAVGARDVERLRDILADLERCVEILDTARRG
jgi:DNA-binding transcriptional MerR regulator